MALSLSPLSLIADSKKEPLSMKQMQQLIDIQSWKVDYTDRKDKKYDVTIEQFMDDKRFSIFTPEGAIGDDRVISIALTKKDEKWNRLTIITQSGSVPQTFPNLGNTLRKKYGDKAYLVYSVIDSNSKRTGGADYIYQATYYLATGDGNGYSSNPSKDKKIGETIIKINYAVDNPE